MELSAQIQGQIDQLAKLPKAVRLALVVGIVVMILAGYYFGMYQGTKGELDGLRAQELELQRKLTEVRSVAANIGAFEQEIAALEVKLTSALRQLPNTKELEVLLTDISNLEKIAGVEINYFRRKPEIVHDFYAEVPIEISLEGGFHDIAFFFDRMAKLPRIVNMGALTIAVKKETLEGTKLKVEGTATTFRFVGNDARI